MYNFSSMRQKMMGGQILPHKIVEPRLIEAMGKLPRERFVLTSQRPYCYADEAVLLNESGTRFLLPPAVFATLVQAAALRNTDRVLDIGCGSGYSSVLLSFLATFVVALESENDFFQEAKKNISDFECYDVQPIKGPLSDGWSFGGPYDVIFIEGTVDEVPKGILSQLKEGGRLLTIERDNESLSRGVLMRRSREGISRHFLFDCACPLLSDFKKDSGFRFEN